MLRAEQDSFGPAMLDHLEGRPAEEIIERDDGLIYAGAGPVLYFAPFPRWRSHEKRAMRFVRGRVLDVGCSAGRPSCTSTNRGIDAIGIDSSPGAIEVCRRRGLSKVVVRSTTELDGLGTFDTILLLGSGFGLFGNRNRARRLLRKMHTITSELGRVVATARDPHASTDPADLRYIKRNRERGRMPGQFRIRIRYGTYCSPWWDYLTVSREELVDVVDGRGWEATRFLDGPEGRYAAVLAK